MTCFRPRTLLPAAVLAAAVLLVPAHPAVAASAGEESRAPEHITAGVAIIRHLLEISPDLASCVHRSGHLKGNHFGPRNNPVLSHLLERCAGEYAPLTHDAVLRKTSTALAVVFAGGAAGWIFQFLYMPGLIIGSALAFFMIFRRRPPTADMVLAYAAFEGMPWAGCRPSSKHSGPASPPGNPGGRQRLRGNLLGLPQEAATFWVFRKKGVRTGKFVSITLMAMIGLLLFAVVNLVLKFTGAVTVSSACTPDTIPGAPIPWGVAIGLIAVLLGAKSSVGAGYYKGDEDGFRDGFNEGILVGLIEGVAVSALVVGGV